MRKALIVCAALTCLVGFFLETPGQRYDASLIAAALVGGDVLLAVARRARQRSWPQFSVRDLLLAVALCGVGMLIVITFLRPIYDRQRFALAVGYLGGTTSSNPDEFNVTLTGKHITDDVLGHLASLPGAQHVTRLHLCKSATRGPLAITDAGMSHLAKFPKLTDVGVTDCPTITDSGLEKLKALSSLERIYMFGCPGITDNGVAWLAERPGLKRIHVLNTQVTPRKMAELKAALLNCEVIQNRP